MVATYATEYYAGRTAITDARTFIETLADGKFVDVECWSEAHNTKILVIYKP